MKVKVISRSTDEFTRERSNDLQVSSVSNLQTLSTIHCILSLTLSLYHSVKVVDFLAIELCQRVFRNFDPSLRTQEKAVEYVRALNAAKMDKVTFF